MVKLNRAWLLAVAALGLNGCLDDAGGTAKGDEVPFAVIAGGAGSDTGAPVQPHFSIVTSQAAVGRFYVEVGGNLSGTGWPIVDHEQDAVFVATLGTRSTSGFSIKVTRVSRSQGAGAGVWTLGFEVEIEVPPEGCALDGVLTTPYEMVAFPLEALSFAVVSVDSKVVVRDGCS